MIKNLFLNLFKDQLLKYMYRYVPILAHKIISCQYLIIIDKESKKQLNYVDILVILQEIWLLTL